MAGPFFGIEVGLRGLQTQQKALEVTGHNIANANTPGFSRQEVIIQATDPYTVPGLIRPMGPGQIGTGATVDRITRMREAFLDQQARNETRNLGRWEARSNSLRELEVIINEPSDSGLRTVLDRFWSALQELANNPESYAVRSLVRESGRTLAESLSNTYRQLNDLKANVNDQVRLKVDEINTIGVQLAELNRQISDARAIGEHPNDLLDRRDLLVEKLSKLIDVTVRDAPDGNSQVFIDGSLFADAYTFRKIEVYGDPGNNNLYALRWQDTGQQIQVHNGQIKGLTEMRDESITGFQQDINKLGFYLMQEFNAIHRTGYGMDGSTGTDFFTADGTTLSTFRVETLRISDAIQADLNKIAAAGSWTGTGSPGDGSNALKLAGLKQQAIVEGATMDDYYRSLVSRLGIDAQEAERRVDNQELLLTAIDNQRQMVSGVSLDEEMANMVKYQHALAASARLISAVDEMLDTIINRLGLVGR